MPLCQQEYLLHINRLIEDRLNPLSSDTFLGDGENALVLAARHLCLSPNAKRVRPLLCLYYNWLFDSEIHDHIFNVGVAAEFIHAASLMHDDIIDDAEKRRGALTINYQSGSKTAVLAGDFLLTEAFSLLLPCERILTDRAIAVVRQMTKAAITEYNSRGIFDVTPMHIKEIALGKTGLLFSWCGFAAAIICRRSDATEDLWDLGKRIGLIFQLADDIKDFDGDNALKDVCRDIRNFDLSMPLVLALQESPSLKEKITAMLAHEKIAESDALAMRDLILNTQAINETKQMIEHEIDQVLSILKKYRSGIGFSHLEEFIRALA